LLRLSSGDGHGDLLPERIRGPLLDALGRNPCRLKGVASERIPEQQVATAPEVERIADAIDPRFRAMVLLAAYGGLRLGELIGLRRHRVNTLKCEVRVAEQVTQPDSNAFITGPPKTDAGSRTITLPREVMQAFEIHLASYSEPGKQGLVFPSPGGGMIRRSNFRRRVWLPALKQAGIERLRFHDLRHSHATLAVAMGVDTKTLMSSMGHARRGLRWPTNTLRPVTPWPTR
jgi:integrase